jgi:hypothetical protein
LRVAPALRADVLRADVFLRVELAFVLRALDFRADVFLREDPERELELRAALLLPDERELEREEDRVVAGTARATSSTLSSSVVSSKVGAPHVSSAVSPLDGSLSEPAVDGSSVSAVPPQSSWVIN